MTDLLPLRFNTSHVKVNHRSECSAWVQGRVSIHPMLKLIPTYFQHSIQYTIPDSPVFINVFKIFTSRRTLCQKNSQNHCNTTVFADSRNFTLIGGWEIFIVLQNQLLTIFPILLSKHLLAKHIFIKQLNNTDKILVFLYHLL